MPAGKMQVDEVDTDASLVRRLLAAQFPQYAGLPLAPIRSAGTDNALYRLGDDMVVRLPRSHWAVKSLDKEHLWLLRLAPLLLVAIPVPLGKGTPAEGYPWHWSVYCWLAGENPTVDRLADPGLLARDLAEFVAALRRIDPTDGPPTDLPWAMQDATVRIAIEALGGMVDTDAVTTAWDAGLQIPKWPGAPVWLHGDLAPGNVLLVDRWLSAVIDFSGVGVGDPSGDLPSRGTVYWPARGSASAPPCSWMTRPGRAVADGPWPRRSSSSRTTGRRIPCSRRTRDT